MLVFVIVMLVKAQNTTIVIFAATLSILVVLGGFLLTRKSPLAAPSSTASNTLGSKPAAVPKLVLVDDDGEVAETTLGEHHSRESYYRALSCAWSITRADVQDVSCDTQQPSPMINHLDTILEVVGFSYPIWS